MTPPIVTISAFPLLSLKERVSSGESNDFFRVVQPIHFSSHSFKNKFIKRNQHDWQ